MNSHIIKDTLYPLVHLSCSTKFLVLGPPALLSQSHIAGSGAWTSGLASESFWLSLNSFQSKKEQKDKQQGLQWAQKLGRPWKKRIGKKVRSRRRERKWGSGRVRKWKRTAWPGKKYHCLSFQVGSWYFLCYPTTPGFPLVCHVALNRIDVFLCMDFLHWAMRVKGHLCYLYTQQLI